MEPSTFTQGDALTWTKSVSGYDPASWTLTYHFVHQSSGKRTIVCTDNGDGSYLATLTNANSAQFVPGVWNWQAVLTDGGTGQLATDEGQLTVKPGFAGMTDAHDKRTYAEKVLEKIEALILDTADNEETNFSIDGISMSFEGKADLRTARDYWRRMVKQEQRAAALKKGSGRDIRVRF